MYKLSWKGADGKFREMHFPRKSKLLGFLGTILEIEPGVNFVIVNELPDLEVLPTAAYKAAEKEMFKDDKK